MACRLEVSHTVWVFHDWQMRGTEPRKAEVIWFDENVVLVRFSAKDVELVERDRVYESRWSAYRRAAMLLTQSAAELAGLAMKRHEQGLEAETPEVSDE